MRTPIFLKKFEKDLEKCKSRGLDTKEIRKVMKLLIEKTPLPASYKNHPISGNYKGFFDCHIHPDWILIYKIHKKNNTITFVRTGTHADLF